MPRARRSLRISAALLAGAAALLPRPSAAESGVNRAIVGADERAPVDNSAPPWSAIGQVNIAGFRKRASCTGTLIAPRVVLTAAHCLIDWEVRGLFPVSDIHFAAGVRRDSRAGRSVARCVKFPEGVHLPAPQRGDPDAYLRRAPVTTPAIDLALIVLAEDIPQAGSIGVLGAGVLPEGLPLIQASYPANRRFVLMADKECKTVARSANLWSTSCGSYRAGSGGPVLAEIDGSLKVAAVVVGSIGRTGTRAVPVASWPAMPLAADCP